MRHYLRCLFYVFLLEEQSGINIYMNPHYTNLATEKIQRQVLSWITKIIEKFDLILRSSHLNSFMYQMILTSPHLSLLYYCQEKEDKNSKNSVMKIQYAMSILV